jgi:hypothetical protein
MSQEERERKSRLKYEAYENDRKFEMFNEDERDLILAIALRDFKLKLEKGGIRNVMKLEIWKTALRELLNHKNSIDLES